MKSEKAWYQGVKLLLSEPIFVKRENHPVAILISYAQFLMTSCDPWLDLRSYGHGVVPPAPSSHGHGSWNGHASHDRTSPRRDPDDAYIIKLSSTSWNFREFSELRSLHVTTTAP